MDFGQRPDLEERFLQPPGWEFSFFTRSKRQIRYGSVSPKNQKPVAAIVCFEGLSENAEKYFEIAHWCLSHNFSFHILDWMGQGQSGRYLDNPYKRHASSFDDDIADAYYFIHSHILSRIVDIPVALLAHSMGANIGLRFLSQHPSIFSCAAFSAPMIAIKALKEWPSFLIDGLVSFFNLTAGTAYVIGSEQWETDRYKTENETMLSLDPVRSKVQNAWFMADPTLQVSGVTFGWISAATRSCAAIQRPGFGHLISVPCLFGLAGQDHLVDNNVTRHFTKTLKHAQIVDFPDSRHEILMERDDIRNDFLDQFYKLIMKVIPS